MGLLMEPVAIQRYDCVPMPYRERWGAIVRRDSPLARLESVGPRELLPWPLLLPVRESVQELLASWFGKGQPQMRVAARFDLHYNAAIMVKHNMGVALCHDLGTAYYDSLCQVPLSPSLENGAVLAWKKEQTRSRAVESFIAHVRNAPEERGAL